MLAAGFSNSPTEHTEVPAGGAASWLHRPSWVQSRCYQALARLEYGTRVPSMEVALSGEKLGTPRQRLGTLRHHVCLRTRSPEVNPGRKGVPGCEYPVCRLGRLEGLQKTHEACSARKGAGGASTAEPGIVSGRKPGWAC